MQQTEIPASGVVAVFPLPNAVLFPRTVLPLHIFEPRYREMVRDASRADGLIAVALLGAGFEEDHEGSPAFHALGTIGRIERLKPLQDGRFTLNLVGLARVELDEIPSGKAYRLARYTVRTESDPDENDSGIVQAKLELLASQAYLMREISDEPGGGIPLYDGLPFASAVNGCCANLPAASEVRQELLEIDDLVSRHGRVLEMVNRVLDGVLKLKGDRPEDHDEHGPN